MNHNLSQNRTTKSEFLNLVKVKKTLYTVKNQSQNIHYTQSKTKVKNPLYTVKNQSQKKHYTQSKTKVKIPLYTVKYQSQKFRNAKSEL